MWNQFSVLMDKSGIVGVPLLLACLGLWFCLGWRAHLLRRGSSEPLRELVSGDRSKSSGFAHRVVQMMKIGDPESAIHALKDELSQMGVVVRSIVVIAPLVGLLGTVNGMITTFDGLAQMALYTQGGGIAGGVSEALFSTQMGLVVAVPGILVGRILERKEARLSAELDELYAWLSQGAT